MDDAKRSAARSRPWAVLVSRPNAARERLDDDGYRRLRCVVGLLSSFSGYDTLTAARGLSRDEAAEAAAWAISVLCGRARRSGVES